MIYGIATLAFIYGICAGALINEMDHINPRKKSKKRKEAAVSVRRSSPHFFDLRAE